MKDANVDLSTSQWTSKETIAAKMVKLIDIKAEKPSEEEQVDVYASLKNRLLGLVTTIPGGFKSSDLKFLRPDSERCSRLS